MIPVDAAKVCGVTASFAQSDLQGGPEVCNRRTIPRDMSARTTHIDASVVYLRKGSGLKATHTSDVGKLSIKTREKPKPRMKRISARIAKPRWVVRVESTGWGEKPQCTEAELADLARGI